MNPAAPRLSYAIAPGWVCFRVEGKPTLDLPRHLREAAQKLIAAGHTQVVVDLTDCPAVDSTFIGVLIFLTKVVQSASPPGRVVLAGLGDLVRNQIDSLGVLGRFELGERPQADAAFADLTLAQADRAQATRLALDAHRELVEANAANTNRFRDVIELLEKDLRRHTPPEAP